MEDRAARTASRDLSASFGTVVAASAAPYGYTVTLWSSGALLMHFRGTPNVADVFLFAAGALTAFGILAVAAHRSLKVNDPLPAGSERVVAGALHWLSVGLALGAVALLAQIHGLAAWPLSSLAATALYLLAASLQLAMLQRAGG